MNNVAVAVKLQEEANLVADLIDGMIESVPKEFRNNVRLDDILQFCITPDPENGPTLTPADCAEELAKTIKRIVGAGSVQFVRFAIPSEHCGMEYARTEAPRLPVTAMALFDVRQGKLIRRFDVRFAVYAETAE